MFLPLQNRLPEGLTAIVRVTQPRSFFRDITDCPHEDCVQCPGPIKDFIDIIVLIDSEWTGNCEIYSSPEAIEETLTNYFGEEVLWNREILHRVMDDPDWELKDSHHIIFFEA